MKTTSLGTALSLVILISGLLSTPFDVSGQTSSTDIRINDVPDLDPHLDGTQALAVHGTNVYAVFTDTVSGGASDLFLARSIDGGSTLEPNVSIFSNSEIASLWASVAVGADGTVHVAWTAVTPLPETGTHETALRGGGLQGNFNIWYVRSTDNGQTFSQPTVITTNNGSVFPAIGVYNNYVHVMYVDASNYPCADYFITTSSDDGLTFNTPVQVNDGACLATVNFEGLGNMTIAPDGTVHVTWVDARRLSGNGDIYTARSEDNGQSFGANVMVNSLTSAGVDAQQFYPSIVTDADDNVYVSFTDMRLGTEWEDHRAYLAVSADGGDTFSEESVLAGFDNYLCKYHKLGISENGELVAVVLSSAGMPDWGVYHLVSQDGGATFSAPFNISDVDGDAPNELSIAVTSDGTTHAVWADEREGMGVTNLYYSNTTNITSIGSANDEVNFRFYPNPTAGELNLILEGRPTEGEIILTDIQGRVVFRNSIPNMNQFALNLDVPQGLYAITLSTPADLYTSQLMVIK